MKKIIVAGLVMALVAAVVMIVIRLTPKEIISPGGGRFGDIVKENKREVIGFLPTWEVGKTRKYGGIISQLVFLGVDVGMSGNLVWDVQAKKINNEKYLELKSDIKAHGGKNILGIKMFDKKVIEKVLSDEGTANVLIEEIRSIVRAGEFDGVNLDFEDMNNPLRVMEDDFLNLAARIKKEINGELSVDVFANTVIKGEKEGWKKLLEVVDRAIVMAYDFHRPSSDWVGPVAPIRAPEGERSITEVMERIVGWELPRNKIITAYPIYGYQWRTVDETYGSQVTDGWSRMVSYAETVERLADGTYDNFTDFKQNWDELSMTPWISFKNKETGEKWVKVNKKWKKVPVEIWKTYQVYYDNRESLEAKLELSKQIDVGGIGFWALGYEGVNSDWWQSVKKYYSL